MAEQAQRSQQSGKLNAGSEWHRWEPHVHTPGTLFNNQFRGEDAWDEYFGSIEKSDPPIRALAVTDYYLTDKYVHVWKAKHDEGRLADVDLIFPNVELRLDTGTSRGKSVNVHLLVSPEDPNHVDELNRFLSRLHFSAHGDKFACTPGDLTLLGHKDDATITDERAALRHGANQFKVSFRQLRDEWNASEWAKANILVAVAGSQTDGTSGVRDAQDRVLRQEMEAFASVIFASSLAQREFWLGLRDTTPADLRARYGGLKPCLHGSDAHDQGTVGAPDGDRFSWVKGGLEFDALRQACIDPEGRAFVGPQPPQHGTPSQLIDRIEIKGADWAMTPVIAFNSGLVSVIGARGSGKTALADMIAMGCDAIHEPDYDEDRRPSSSFLTRASDLLSGASVTVHWRAGEPTTRALDGSTTPAVRYERARYLSQQFVEDLCSSSGMTDELLREIERVIFEAHPLVDRDGALDFSDLLELRAARFRQARQREEEALVHLSDRIGAEIEKDKQIGDYSAQKLQKEQHIAGYTADRAKLVADGSEERLNRLTELTAAAETVRGFLRFYSNQEQALLALKDEVSDLRQNQAPELLRRSQERHAASKMKPDQWAPFRIDYTGDVDAQIATLLEASRKSAASWRGVRPPPPATPETPLVGDAVELDTQSLAILEAEIERIQKLVSADVVTQKQFAALSTKIVEESNALEVLKEKLTDAEGAKERAKELLLEREASYRRVFEAISSEQDVLVNLYEPLMTRLEEASGTLRKLTFTVTRTADVARWAQFAETNLVDLRLKGDFKGTGSLGAIAEDMLKPAWEQGDPQAVTDAMRAFRDKHQEGLLEHANVSKAGNQGDYRAWTKRFAQWLFSTDHIQLQYGIDYDGVDIRKLSPGTRGIVLLLLYLALDDADDKPLIIDQPEENLDPKSVFEELVGLFTSAKARRQVIMVTHNANLVINTDADQIIVAEAGHHLRGQLPAITYTSGGLENVAIRKSVCDILEGGEDAFKERARRLRVRLER